MISWDKELIAAIAKRRCVIVIGSGVSKNSINKEGKRPFSWLEFLDYHCKNLGENKTIRDLINQRDFLTACQIIKKTILVIMRQGIKYCHLTLTNYKILLTR